jgi:hypothetical protein
MEANCMSQGHGIGIVDARRLLVERVVLSPYLSRSARLRELLVYLTDRVLDDEAGEIHEQEVGHKVFGRPRDYDTTADNIVRVHASMLRKRLKEYFDHEGAGESLIVEIPKGNYAPVFHERAAAAAPSAAPERRGADWRVIALAAAAGLFACSTAVLLLRPAVKAHVELAGPVVRQFWSQVFRSDKPSDIVFDDAALALYQEMSGRTVALSEYFDHSFLRAIPATDPMANLVQRRQSSYAGASFLAKLTQIGGSPGVNLRFAREYSYRELRTNNAVLLGNSRSNPWFQAFEAKQGIRWQFDSGVGSYYPVDAWNANQSYRGGGDTHYFSVALAPNLGGTGNVLLISSTGGSAMKAGADFLCDERVMSGLRTKLPGRDGFPHFEALIQVKSLPKDAVVVVVRGM